ncbi:MAG: response regulator [Lachnospiraceae bacterium]|nr:response regulator [Lachnospiraceae bacterium]
MYHCHIQFYLTGQSCKAYEVFKSMPPLEQFTHEFTESCGLDEALAWKADVIFVNLADGDAQGMDALRRLCGALKQNVQMIVLAEGGQTAGVEEYLPQIKDLWIMPMTETELRFRFLRWQQSFQMEKDFWQTSQYLEATINNVPHLIWYKDKDGVHEKVNDSFCRTVNKTRTQVEGQRHAYIWNVDEDDPACIESEREVMEKRDTCIADEIIKTGDGMRTLVTYKSPLYDVDGSVMGTVGVAVDVTRERSYQEEILKKNRLLETIFTTLDCGVITHALDGRILSINKAALKILGYESLKEIEASGFNMVAPSVLDEDKEKFRQSIAKLKNQGDSISVEYRVRHKDGALLHVAGNVMLLEENGELFYRRFLLDCTAQRLQEERNIRHQNELVQALSIDYNLVCFFELDTGVGTVLRSDERGQSLKEIFHDGITLEDSIGQYIRQFVAAEDKERLSGALSAENISGELAEKPMFSVNYRTIRDGGVEYFQVKVVRSGAWGAHRGIVLGFHSVDEEIRSEMEKKNLLEEALTQANQASKAKSVFLSNMSHDIRTPMNAIVGFTSLAITHIDHKEKVEEYLGKIMTSGNHLLSLINNVLDMSRIESGKMQLEEKPCSLLEIVNGLHNIVQADAYAKQLKLQIDTVDIQHEEICCDRLRLNQVLLNLLSNSVKYTEAGGTINMKVLETGGAPEGFANYEFHIKDNGIGMSEEFAQHIFEPFEREENSTISGIQGTGLGMAITKNIVDMMSGTISVETKQGVGTEFTVCFRFRISSEMPEYQEKSRKDTGEKGIGSRTGRILLAEDVELNQEIAVTILGDAGFETDVAENGQAALEMLQKSKPGYYKLILMDIQMPVMNGYEATKAIRQLADKELASIPIIAMSANAFEEDKREALKSGMNGHIAKPIDIENLFETLGEILG